MKKLFVLLGVLVLAPLFFMSQQSSPNNLNGFTADPGSFEILNRFQGKNNVLKVDRSKTNWFITSYPLGQYRGKQIAIEFSVDVWVEGSGNMLMWSLNDPPNNPMLSNNNPMVSMLESAAPDQWHNMRGRAIVTPAQSYTVLFLSNWGHPNNKIFYIANPTVRITENLSLTPDLSLPSLKDIYANDFLIGNIIDWNGMYNSGRYLDLLKHHYNILTTSAQLEARSIAPLNKGGVYRFTDTDNTINHFIRNNFQVLGHPLVFHAEQTPVWMTEGSREEVI